MPSAHELSEIKAKFNDVVSEEVNSFVNNPPYDLSKIQVLMEQEEKNQYSKQIVEKVRVELEKKELNLQVISVLVEIYNKRRTSAENAVEIIEIERKLFRLYAEATKFSQVRNVALKNLQRMSEHACLLKVRKLAAEMLAREKKYDLENGSKDIVRLARKNDAPASQFPSAPSPSFPRPSAPPLSALDDGLLTLNQLKEEFNVVLDSGRLDVAVQDNQALERIARLNSSPGLGELVKHNYQRIEEARQAKALSSCRDGLFAGGSAEEKERKQFVKSSHAKAWDPECSV